MKPLCAAKPPLLSFLPTSWNRKRRRDSGFHWLNEYPFVSQTGDTFQKEVITVIAHRLLTERQHLGDLTDAQVLSQGKQGMDAFDALQRAMGVGLLETAIELLVGERVQV